MPDTPTTRLGLYKSLSDGSELVNYSQDIGQNWDKVDAAVGFQVVTSSTRPSSPYSGKGIAESDTSYRTYFSNGTSPASASWVQIPNSSSTFNADLDLTSGKQLNIGSSASTASIAIVNPTTGTDALSLRVTGDTASRYLLDTDGAMSWGPGGGTTPDTTLARTGTAALTITGALTTTSNLTVGGNLSVTGNLAVTGIGARSYVRKTADESVTSSTTLQNDNELVLAVSASATYFFRVWLMATDATDANGDIKFAFTFPTGAVCHFSGKGPHTLLASGAFGDGEYIARNTATSGSTVASYGLTTSVIGIELTGLLIVSGTAGNLQLQWAQNTSDANATTVQAGSFMTLERIA
ncbi:hypothetical protein [Streptomyces ipomoeae]|uniref:hypothetical protein n=1 Tax=Streptomyces ipomoeae TaxID=103232 RepID=UPI0029B275FE|nr:hypothetical protein [Streptomyces ipomoeae]MDX2697018.1 hypothetical protein [Streptomyces ipomoeae]